jgi:hypothetical protein
MSQTRSDLGRVRLEFHNRSTAETLPGEKSSIPHDQSGPQFGIFDDRQNPGDPELLSGLLSGGAQGQIC